MIRCAECGHENMDGLEYCDACGAKLPAVAPAPAEAVVAAAPVESSATVQSEAESVAVSAPTEVAPVASEAPTVSTEPVSVAVDVPSTTPKNAKLTIVRGGTVGKEFPLQAGDNLVGRWDPDSGSFPEVDLELDDPEARISRKHALIRLGKDISIEDIGSLNGTFVNRGRRLEVGSPVSLHDGDEIIIGKTFFKLSLS